MDLDKEDIVGYIKAETSGMLGVGATCKIQKNSKGTFFNVHLVNSRRNAPKDEIGPLKMKRDFWTIFLIDYFSSLVLRFQLLICESLTEDGTYRSWLLICKPLMEDSTHWPQLLICESLTKDSTYRSWLLICESLTEDGTHGSRILICKSLTKDGTYGSRLLICKSLTEDGTCR
ncbi:unnamed protein product [Rhizophagus irregularis]|nr:unnamed protein product [Rhizophagus irregularis]